MMKHSAGLLLYRRDKTGRHGAGIEVLLVHPGGPFWAGKDAHAWSMPKGEIDPDEDALAAAQREFAEETGFAPAEVAASGAAIALGRYKHGQKIIQAWAIEGDCDPARLRSNSFSMEWPPRSGQMRDFPEADRAAWFDLATARRRIHKNQLPFLDALEACLARGAGAPD
ncbi:MAG TPA: NUDIX domain-containing protein [Ferrovibrio sp.]|uniref:NUDIX domain-containing protein n=1 Tax=Ferrovibrio sp. TaxID=1917215 RepID=UPI002ED394AA